MNATNTETVDTWSFGWCTDWTEAQHYVLQRIFGSLVRIAAPVVQEFHGDLFHDAEWLRQHLTGPMEFWFCARTSGTHIGLMDDTIWLNSVRGVNRSDKDAKFVRCTLTQDGGRWEFTVTDITEES